MSGDVIHLHQMTNTHILVHDFAYQEPTSLQEAIALLREYGNHAHVLAGGTDLLVQMKMERMAPKYVINLQRIPGLEGVWWRDSHLRIGACTSVRAIRDALEIWRDYTALAEACAAFGSTQIQMMGTIGGNVCNGSPASDTVPALMAFNAQLLLVGSAGERVVPIEEFCLEPGKTALQQGELLASIVLPRPQRGTGSAFIKLSRVQADLAKVSAAAALVREGERVVDCRLSFGAVAPTVWRGRRSETLLIGQTFSPELALEAGTMASEDASPVDDVRSTAWYRREVLKAVTHDVLCLAWKRAGESAVGQSGTWVSTGGAASDTRHPYGIGNPLQLARHTHNEIALTVNGTRHRVWVTPNELLLNVLRERLELTGTKYGCGIGECGACTVHLNGKPALACLTLAIAADGSEVLTVEGLQSPDGVLDPLQEMFIEHQAFQCGYCTPGMLMLSKSLLHEMPSPTEDDVRNYLKGNRCRCTGFASIVRAVIHCAQRVGDSM
jgi:carbon-monoxide dehydrogenase medium subunit